MRDRGETSIARRRLPMVLRGRSRRACATLVALVLSAVACAVTEAGEIPCGKEHTVQPGETLSRLAQRAYGNRLKWPAIASANEERLSRGQTLVAPGQQLLIPCIDGVAGTHGQAAEPVPTSSDVVPAASAATLSPAVAVVEPMTQIGLLTADNFVPFSDRALPNGGLMTELLERALQASTRMAELPRQLHWISDRSSHDQLLGRAVGFDVGFPWERPDCDYADQLGSAARKMCQRFLFTKPFVEEIGRLFVLSSSDFTFVDDVEILGRRICATTNTQIEGLEANGRHWVSDEKIVLFRAGQPECFRMLQAKEVDAVYASDLAGISAINTMGLTNNVRALERPVAISALSAIVSRAHPHAADIVASINDGLALLRQNGEYDEVVTRHLDEFWQTNVEQ